jgi:superfamily II DNA/RNA helicase
MAMPMYAASEQTPVSKCHVAYSTETFLHTYTHTFIHIYDRARTETKKDAGDFFADASIEMARGVFYRDVSSYIHTYIYTYIRSRTYIQDPRTRLTSSARCERQGDMWHSSSIHAFTNNHIYIHTETKKEADELGLDANIKVTCGILHGDIPQAQREQVFKGFREGTVQVCW